MAKNIKRNDSDEMNEKFENALKTFVQKVSPDPNILGVIVNGSLSNDVVWEKSDMDVIVIVREIKLSTYSFCIDEDGIVINVDLMKMFDFKRMLEKMWGGEFLHSFFSKSRIAYTTDESLHDFLNDVQKIGADDRALAFFNAACHLIGTIEKIEKWLTVKDDPLYAQHWILKAADIYANMILTLNNLPGSRESVLKVMDIAPEKMKIVYEEPLSRRLSREEVQNVIDLYRDFLIDNLDLLKQPVTEYMADGGVRTITTLVKQFRMDSHGIYHVFDFLAEQDVVVRVSETTRITPKSRKAVEEIAFMCIPDAPNMFGM